MRVLDDTFMKRGRERTLITILDRILSGSDSNEESVSFLSSLSNTFTNFLRTQKRRSKSRLSKKNSEGGKVRLESWRIFHQNRSFFPSYIRFRCARCFMVTKTETSTPRQSNHISSLSLYSLLRSFSLFSPLFLFSSLSFL